MACLKGKAMVKRDKYKKLKGQKKKIPTSTKLPGHIDKLTQIQTDTKI